MHQLALGSWSLGELDLDTNMNFEESNRLLIGVDVNPSAVGCAVSIYDSSNATARARPLAASVLLSVQKPYNPKNNVSNAEIRRGKKRALITRFRKKQNRSLAMKLMTTAGLISHKQPNQSYASQKDALFVAVLNKNQSLSDNLYPSLRVKGVTERLDKDEIATSILNLLYHRGANLKQKPLGEKEQKDAGKIKQASSFLSKEVSSGKYPTIDHYLVVAGKTRKHPGPNMEAGISREMIMC